MKDNLSHGMESVLFGSRLTQKVIGVLAIGTLIYVSGMFAAVDSAFRLGTNPDGTVCQYGNQPGSGAGYGYASVECFPRPTNNPGRQSGITGLPTPSGIIRNDSPVVTDTYFVDDNADPNSATSTNQSVMTDQDPISASSSAEVMSEELQNQDAVNTQTGLTSTIYGPLAGVGSTTLVAVAAADGFIGISEGSLVESGPLTDLPPYGIYLMLLLMTLWGSAGVYSVKQTV